MDSSAFKEAVDILIPIGFFAMIAAIVIMPRYFRSLERQKMAETVRAAIERGQPLPAEVVEALKPEPDQRRPNTPQRDLRRGLMLVAVALGLVAAGMLGLGDGGHVEHSAIAAAAIPGFLGVAFILMSLLDRART